jgi:hypothetical protein
MNHELKVDKRVLKVVERGLGLKVPTRIRHVALLTGENPLSEVMASLTGGFAAGAQYMRTMNGKHQIEVKTRLSRYDADVALNHELRHAHQLERLGGNEAFRHAYDMASRRACWQNGCGCLRLDCQVGYWRNTYEMEARFYESFLRVFGGIPQIHQRPSRGIIGRLTSNG